MISTSRGEKGKGWGSFLSGEFSVYADRAGYCGRGCRYWWIAVGVGRFYSLPDRFDCNIVPYHAGVVIMRCSTSTHYSKG